MFPLKTLVWPGSLLASIAHAVYVARTPLMAHEQSWDGSNYNVQDSHGSRGTIAFDDDKTCFVGVFYLETSERNPYTHGVRKPPESTALQRRVPQQLRKLADEALQYVLQDMDGNAVPVITAAFWSDPASSHVTGSEPWPDIVKDGAIIVKNQLLPVETGIEQWIRDYDLTPAQTKLTLSLFQRRLTAVSGAIQLSSAQGQQIKNIAISDDGLEACRVSLGEIGIILS